MQSLHFRTLLYAGACLLMLLAAPVQAQSTTPLPPLEDEFTDAGLDDDTFDDADLDDFAFLSNEAIAGDIILLLDNSGSMKANDPQFLTAKAVTDFINQLDANTRAGIVIFDQKVTLAHPLTPISDTSRAAMLDSLQQVNYQGTHTNSPDGLERAIYELKLQARDDAERFIIFLTDGIVDTGDKQKDLAKAGWMRQELAADARENDIKIFGIAFTDNADFQLIQSLAQQTDAEYFRAFQADDLAAVFNSIQQSIAAVRLAKLQASQPPPVVEVPPPPPPAEPIIVKVPETTEHNNTTRYLLFGVAGLLVLLIIIILLRDRTATARSGGEKIPEVKLLDMRGVTGQKSFDLTTRITQIGRIKGKESDEVGYIVIPEAGVSRHHAVIEYRNHAFWIMDQGSGNGSKLNNQLLTEEHRLKHGDILTFDNYNFMFSDPEIEQSDSTVIQQPGDQQSVDMAFDESDTQLLSNNDGDAGDKETEATTDEAVDIISGWDIDDIDDLDDGDRTRPTQIGAGAGSSDDNKNS